MNYKLKHLEVLNLHDRSNDDIPSKKIKNSGVNSLSNVELLSLIIGESNENIEKLRILISENRNKLSEISKLSIEEISEISKLSIKQSTKILVSLSLINRLKYENCEKDFRIVNSKSCFEVLNPFLSNLYYEEVWLLLLNTNNVVIDKIKISQGGYNQSTVDLKVIFKHVLLKNSTGIILSHNHPSGNVNPSSCDETLTSKIKKSCENLDIRFLDHIIISGDKYFSFADEGLI
jgi:DNA repair protein RadC